MSYEASIRIEDLVQQRYFITIKAIFTARHIDTRSSESTHLFKDMLQKGRFN